MKAKALIACLLTVVTIVMVVQTHLSWAHADSNLRITEPSNGQKTGNTWIQVRFELIDPAVAASRTPTFRVQLDSRSPIETTSNSHNFTGLTPGAHTVLIQLVDAHGLPVPGATNAARFTVAPTSPQGAVYQQDSPGSPQLHPASAEKLETHDSGDKNLPNAGGALPLLSLIGFGVLVGGIVSALKTR